MRESKSNRDENGCLLPGHTANPDGNNGHNKGWQRYGTRIQKWLHLNGDEVNEILNDKSRLGKLSTIDIICLKHIQGTMVGEKIKDERESLLDRIEGKPDTKINVRHAGKLALTTESVQDIDSWLDGVATRKEIVEDESTSST